MMAFHSTDATVARTMFQVSGVAGQPSTRILNGDINGTPAFPLGWTHCGVSFFGGGLTMVVTAKSVSTVERLHRVNVVKLADHFIDPIIDLAPGFLLAHALFGMKQ